MIFVSMLSSLIAKSVHTASAGGEAMSGEEAISGHNLFDDSFKENSLQSEK